MAVFIVDKKGITREIYGHKGLAFIFRLVSWAVSERRKGREKEREDTVKLLYLLT